MQQTAGGCWRPGGRGHRRPRRRGGGARGREPLRAVPAGAAGPGAGVPGAMGEAFQRGQAAAPGVLGRRPGRAWAPSPPASASCRSRRRSGVGFTPEQAEAQGRLAGIVSPGLGGLEQGSRRLGQLATAGLGAIGATKGALETPGGLGERAGGALEGGLNWAQFGQPVGAVADLATRLPYRFGQAARKPRTTRPWASAGGSGSGCPRSPRSSRRSGRGTGRRSSGSSTPSPACGARARRGRRRRRPALPGRGQGRGGGGRRPGLPRRQGPRGRAARSPSGVVPASTETGDGLLGLARRATEPLMARGAMTPGERAFDVAAGTAGGVAGAATADEDATWQERAGAGRPGRLPGGPGRGQPAPAGARGAAGAVGETVEARRCRSPGGCAGPGPGWAGGQADVLTIMGASP